MLEDKWTVEEEEPYEMYLKYKGHRVAKFNLDDAPVHDWNRAVKLIAADIVEELNRYDHIEYFGY